MARKSLELKGINTQRLDKRDLVGRAFTHSTSDFPKIFENNARKAMLKGYEEAEEVFSDLPVQAIFQISKRINVWAWVYLTPSRKSKKAVNISMALSQNVLRPFNWQPMAKCSRSRQAIINDDLNAFTDIPRKMGRAAARTVGDLVFKIITDNVTMSDGTALFHADHNNLAGSARHYRRHPWCRKNRHAHKKMVKPL